METVKKREEDMRKTVGEIMSLFSYLEDERNAMMWHYRNVVRTIREIERKIAHLKLLIP